jgi:iron complex transport system substrate-binding protein
MAHRTARFMRGCVRRFSPLIALAFSAGAVMAAPPERVVSINLCTDQLAMLLADPSQLVSVSHLASDPLSSSMVEQARAYPANRGSAEQVFLLQPDLVLAGVYTPAETVSLLQRLGVTVVQVPIANSTAQAADVMRMVGQALGHPERGEAMASAFLADLSALAVPGDKASAAMYFPQGYTTGDGTLSNEVLALTGFRNVAVEAGLTGGGILPLERLVMADPAMIVTSTPYPGASRAEEILVHPALAAVRAQAGETRTTDADWVCGTPALLNAVRAMADARRGLE